MNVCVCVCVFVCLSVRLLLICVLVLIEVKNFRHHVTISGHKHTQKLSLPWFWINIQLKQRGRVQKKSGPTEEQKGAQRHISCHI